MPPPKATDLQDTPEIQINSLETMKLITQRSEEVKQGNENK